MAADNIERREAGLYMTGSRVPLDRIIGEYRNGEDPETIQSHYPTLTLEQVEEAIAFYQSDTAHPNPPDIQQKFERMRRQIASRRT